VKVFPAIDLKDNKCVRLTKGIDSTSQIFNPDPVDQAKYFEDQGSSKLHLVDLDSAFGRSEINNKTIQKIRKSISIPIQLGGGIRDNKIAKKYFELGINHLIIGSYAIKNTAKVIELSESFQDSIYIALDVLGENIMINGWQQKSLFTPAKLFQHYDKTKIRGYVLTDIENDGMLSGLNLNMISLNLSLTIKKLIVGGGLKNMYDIKGLKKIQTPKLEGVIAGKAFYIGDIDLKKADKMLSANA
jgi:phosphoribosylformimino-5-aminoimidazole carboxamide ribotide isomerase